jgi:hypothetical protein
MICGVIEEEEEVIFTVVLMMKSGNKLGEDHIATVMFTKT